MNNDQYMDQLKKALAGMNRQAREEILQEIQSHIEESGGDSQSLLDMFGPPEQLASQYLEDEPLSTPLTKKIAGISGKVFMVIGIVVIALITAVAIWVKFIISDDFNYADENAKELRSAKQQWSQIEPVQPIRFDLSQSQLVLYWHEDSRILWNCEGENVPQQLDDGLIELRHTSCLMYLPGEDSAVKALQSNIVIVRPRSGINLEIEQSKLRIAENNTRYRYRIDKRRSEVTNLASHDEAEIEIGINALESSISAYEH